jgi:hypothetical protein
MSERNNEQRLADDQPASVSAEQKQDKKADLLSFLSPTHFVDLPSKGKFYTPDHPLFNKDTVEIRFMTAKEEDILTSKSLLKKGIAVDRMLESVLVDKQIKLDDLLIGDKNALIVGARITGYGNEYDTKVQCPSCGANVRHTFYLDELTNKHPSEEVKKQLCETRTFKTKLPITKFEVEMRLLKGSDEKILSQLSEQKKASKKEETPMSDQLKLLVVSVNGVNDKDIIEKFIDMCPAGDAKHMRKLYTDNIPNIDMTQKFTCRSCDSEMEMEVPFTVDFFWSGR